MPDILSNLLADSIGPISEEPTQLETTTQKVESSVIEGPQGEITSTISVSYTTIRAVRKRFMTDIADSQLAAVVESANSKAHSIIESTQNGQDLELQIIEHMEIARLLQSILYDHVREAHKAGAPTKLTTQELEAFKIKRAQEKAARLEKEGKKGKKQAKTLKNSAEREKRPLWEKLTKSTDKNMQAAGKFLKSQMGIVSEKAAVIAWNNLIEKMNPSAMILNVEGKRLDLFMPEKEKK